MARLKEDKICFEKFFCTIIFQFQLFFLAIRTRLSSLCRKIIFCIGFHLLWWRRKRESCSALLRLIVFLNVCSAQNSLNVKEADFEVVYCPTLRDNEIICNLSHSIWILLSVTWKLKLFSQEKSFQIFYMTLRVCIISFLRYAHFQMTV